MKCRAIPYEGKNPYIFVSYCPDDWNLISPLLEQMATDGYCVWYDENSRNQEDWQDRVGSHIEDCSTVLVFVTGSYGQSHDCRSELLLAMKCRKKILPVVLEDVPIPKGLQMQISYLQGLKKTGFPSRKAMFTQIYQTEGFSACKAADGSTLLRTVKEESDPDTWTCSCGQEAQGNFCSHCGSKKPAAEKKPEPEKKPDSEKQPEPEKKPEPEKQPEPEKKPESEKQPEPEKKPEPETQPESEKQPVTEDVDDDGEKTIYGTNVTEDPEDDDKTQRVSSRSMGVLIHPAEQKIYVIRKPQVKIGRSPIKCDIAIEGNDSVSKHHADIIQYQNKCFLRDAGSANGTFLFGDQLESGKQVQLNNPAIFSLNDETLILITGIKARRIIQQKAVHILMNEENTAVALLDTTEFPLNRNHAWPDGTLKDPKVHRSEHALIKKESDGVYLVDDRPNGGNGTYHNGARLKPGSSSLLTSGDRIRLGDTTLEYISVTM